MPESRVLRQLVEALLFEGLVTRATHRARAGGEEVSFRAGASTYRCRARVGAFGRVRVQADSVRKLQQRKARPSTWRELLEDLPGDAARKAQVAEELENTVRLCRWNLDHAPALRQSRPTLGYDALESALHEGHPYHPCFKSRVGFTIGDHAAYGPESGRTFKLHWLAVRRAALRQTLPASEPVFFGAELWGKLSRARQHVAAPLEEYGVLPVHPWQWRQLQASPAFAAALSRRELVDLRLEAGEYRASQSLRTLLPAHDTRADHVKLPLAVRISSSLRTLEPETVRVAPAISAWLQSLVDADPFFTQVADAVVLAEHASAVYAPPTAAGAELESQLSAIWRQPIAPCLRAGEGALPFNALFARETDGEPFIDTWIQRHGLLPWLERLLRVTLLPLVRLLTHHGVALEAHAQNLLLVQRQGMPERLALRDFHDSLEYVPSFLAEPERAPDLGQLDARFRGARPGRYHAVSSVVELRDLFIDTVMVFNLSELSWLLEGAYGFCEADFWRLARLVLDDYLRSPWCDASRAAELRLDAAFVHTESLFKARLCPPGDGSFLHVVPNALHAHHLERQTHAGHQ